MKPGNPLEIPDMESFLAKREEWLHWLDSNHPHSIANQLVILLVEDRTFRTINEARKLIEEGQGGTAAFNNHVLDLLDRGFVTRQSLGLRRLLDPPQDRRPQRQVVSLRRLLDDMKAQRHLITREHYVGFDGTAYDYEPAYRAYHESLSANYDELEMHSGPLVDAWAVSLNRHQTFDRLSEITPSSRSRDDVVSEAIFERIERLLEGAGIASIGNLANKHFAHAADEFSLSTLTSEERSLDLYKLAVAHQTLVQVVQFVCATILNGPSQSFLPTTLYDPIKNFDKPWVDPKNMATIRAFWKAIDG